MAQYGRTSFSRRQQCSDRHYRQAAERYTPVAKARPRWYNDSMIDSQKSDERAEVQVTSDAATSQPASEDATPLRKPGFGEIILPLVVAPVVLLIDQLSKRYVEANIPLYTSWAPFPTLANIFQFTHTANTGAVFGLFQGTSMFFAVLAIIVASGIIYFSLTLPGGQWLLRLALGLQLGGALGNLTDRLRIGHVTDFIDIGPWYIFNVADMALIGGIILFGVVLIRDERRNAAAAASTPRPADTQER